jgi:hypothetical protein
MFCDECKVEMDSGYGLAGGGLGPYFYCPKCYKFIKFQDPEMGYAGQVPEDARQVREEDVPPSGEDKGG